MNGWRPRYNPWAIALTVTLATFMEVLDTSIANVSLPHIAGNLSVGIDASTWILTSYLVANAVVLPLSGWLSALIGRKRFYMTCVALFTVSSFLCGLAPNLELLIFFRVLQGLGGGGLQPSEQAILADTFPPEKRGMAFAVYGMAVVLAPAVGPTLGGFITDNISWRWIFFINVPVGIVSMMLTARLVEDPPWIRPHSRRAADIDYIGLGLVVVGLGCLQIVLDKGERDDWFGSNLIVGLSLAAAVALVSTVVWEAKQARPIIEVRLLRNRNFAAACTMMLMLGGVLFGTTVLLPQFLQVLLGYTAEQAGKVLSPGGLVVILLLPLVGWLLSKVDARWLIAFGFVATALALFYMTNIYLGISFSTAVKFRIYQSIGLAFLFVPISTAAYVDIPIEKNNQVSALTNLARNLGGSIGISVGTTLIARRAQHHQTHLAAHIDRYNPIFRSMAGGVARALAHRGAQGADATRKAYAVVYRLVVQQATTLAYIDTLYVFAMAATVMIPLVLIMKANRPGAPAAH